MSIANFAGFAGTIVGLFFGLPLAGEFERPMPRERLARFSLPWSFLKISMTAGTDVLRSRSLSRSQSILYSFWQCLGESKLLAERVFRALEVFKAAPRTPVGIGMFGGATVQSLDVTCMTSDKGMQKQK